jgi:[ribosomal protein S5]-alanine N-acetyltransferase
MIELETSRLRLLPFAWDDLDEVASIGSDPNTRGFLWDGPTDYQATAANLRRWMKEYERGLGQLGIRAKLGEELVGHCGLMERDGRIVLAYALSKSHWCKGLAPEACDAVLRYAFEVLELEEIWTGTKAENHAWRGMMEKLGMTLRETKRSGEGEEVRYAVSREEFLGVPSTSGNPSRIVS